MEARGERDHLTAFGYILWVFLETSPPDVMGLGFIGLGDDELQVLVQGNALLRQLQAHHRPSKSWKYK